MKKVLVINPFGIGDVLFTTPLIRALKNAGSGYRVYYWCNQRVRPVLENNPAIDKVFALSRGDLKKIFQQSAWEGVRRLLGLLRGLKKEKFDLAFDFSLDQRYSLIAKIIGIKQRIGFNYKKRGRFLTQKIDIAGYCGKHVVDYYLGLLSFIGLKPQKNNLELYSTEKDRLRIKFLLEYAGLSANEKLVGIFAGAGASWGKDATLKHWSALKFAQLADRIISELGARVLLLGDEAERPLAETIKHAAKHEVIDLVGKTSLGELIAMIERPELIVTNDGGPLHMAVALGKKTVSIFGPVAELVYGPYPPGEKHIVIKSNVTCRPCYKNFRMPLCTEERICISSITVDEVFALVRRLW